VNLRGHDHGAVGGVVSLLIDVNDELHSFFSPQTLCSQRITKKINEGRRHKDTLIVFDYIRKLACWMSVT